MKLNKICLLWQMLIGWRCVLDRINNPRQILGLGEDRARKREQKCLLVGKTPSVISCSWTVEHTCPNTEALGWGTRTHRGDSTAGNGTDGELSSTSTSGLDFFFLLKNNSRHNFEAMVQRLPSSSQEMWTFLTWNNFAHHLSQCWLGFSFSLSFSTFKCVCIHTHIQAPLCFTIRFGIFRCLLSSSWRDTLILSLPFVPTLFSG